MVSLGETQPGGGCAGDRVGTAPVAPNSAAAHQEPGVPLRLGDRDTPRSWAEKAQLAAQLPAHLPRMRHTPEAACTARNCSGFAGGMHIHVMQGTTVSEI